MVLAQKQKYGSMEQDRKPREINPSQLIYDKGGRIYSGEKTSYSISGAGKTGQLHVKE